MDVLLGVVGHFILWFLILLIGRRIGTLSGMGTPDPIESIQRSAIFGVSLVVLLQYLLLLGSCYGGRNLGLTLLALVLYSSREVSGTFADLTGTWKRLRPLSRRLSSRFLFARLAWWMIAINALILLLGTVGPPTSMDALNYHLYVPKLWLDRGSLWPGNYPVMFEFWPMTTETLMMFGLVTGIEVVGTLFPLSFLVLLLLRLKQLVELLGHRKRHATTLLTFLLVSTCSLTMWLATSIFVEIVTTYFILSAAYHVLDSKHVGGHPRSIILAGWCVGLAASTKFVAVPFVGILGLVLLVTGDAGSGPWRSRLWEAFRLGLISLVPQILWAGRSFHYTSDPWYPTLAVRLQDLPETQRLMTFALEGYGVGRDVYAFFYTPIGLLLESGRYDAGILFNPVIWFGLGAFLLWPFRARGARAEYGILVGGSYVIWFLLSHQTRFLHPLLTLLAPLCAALALHSRGSWSGWSRGLRGIVFLSCAGHLLVNAWFCGRNVPYVLGRQSREEYLDRNAWHHRQIREINAYLKSIPNALLYFGPRPAYYLEVDHIKHTFDLDIGEAIDHALSEDRRVFAYTTKKHHPALERRGKVIRTFECRLIVNQMFDQFKTVESYLWEIKG